MEIITDRDKIYFLQRKLKDKLEGLLNKVQLRKVSIAQLSEPVEINYDDQIRKWFHYQDNFSEKKHSFFLGKWTTGGGPLPSSGSISISYEGETKNAGIFAVRDGETFLLHSGRMGHKTVKTFFQNFEGETIDLIVNGKNKQYAVVCMMNSQDMAERVVSFF